jgi:CRISPR-associated protein Csd2
MNNTVHVHFLLEVEDSNPNGDANTGQPRLTDNYNKGFITDVCIKRRIREYLSNNGVPIYFRNDEFRDDQKKHMSVEYKRQKSEEGYTGTFSEFILDNYVDARAFGVAPGIAGIESAQAGMSFMRKNKTINNIVVEDIDITGIRNKENAKDTDGDKDNDSNESTTYSTFGSFSLVNFGLYRGDISIAKKYADSNKLTNDDINVIVHALANCFEENMNCTKQGIRCVAIFVVSSSMYKNCRKVFDYADRFKDQHEGENLTPTSKDDVVLNLDELPFDAEIYSYDFKNSFNEGKAVFKHGISLR